MTRREFAKKSALLLAGMGVPAVGFPSILTRSKRMLEKPSGAVCINWGHPLAQGLSYLLPLNEGGGINGSATQREIIESVGGMTAETNEPASCSWVDGVGGKAIRFATVGANIGFIGAGKDALMPLDRITVLMIRRFTDATIRAGCTSFGYAVATADTGHVALAAPTSTSTWNWRFGGAGAQVIVAGVGKSQTMDYVACVAGGRGSSIWRNGQLLGSQATPLTRTSNPSTSFNINRGNGLATGGDLQEVYFFAVYREEWTPDQIAWWMAEPYGMLMPQSPKIRYFLMPGTSLGKRLRVFVNT